MSVAKIKPETLRSSAESAAQESTVLTIDTLRRRMAPKGIHTITALAKRIKHARPVVYFAIERPTRFPKVYEKILKEIA